MVLFLALLSGEVFTNEKRGIKWLVMSLRIAFLFAKIITSFLGYME